MCGGIQGMMGSQMNKDSEETESNSWNALNPLSINKTKDAIESARTGDPNTKLGGGTLGSILERTRRTNLMINEL